MAKKFKKMHSLKEDHKDSCSFREGHKKFVKQARKAKKYY